MDVVLVFMVLDVLCHPVYSVVLCRVLLLKWTRTRIELGSDRVLDP